MSTEPMDTVPSVWVPWTLSRFSMDIVQTIHLFQDDGQYLGRYGQCPLSPWTLSSMCGFPGLCPDFPWTLSRLSTYSMDNIQVGHEQYPGSQRTMSMDSIRHFTEG